MSTAKKAFIQRQHYLLSEEKRKEAKKHGKAIHYKRKANKLLSY